MPSGRSQDRTERELQPEFLLTTLGGVWQGGEYLQASGEVGNRFHVRRVGDSLLARLLPVGQGGSTVASLGIMMGQEGRLCCGGLRGALDEEPRNLRVQVLARALA